MKIYRKLHDWYLWDNTPFEKARAWIDMIMLANYKPGVIDVRGIVVKVDRGQLGWSKKRLAKRWGWSEGMVTRFFMRLENDAQIVVQKNNVTSLITIKNYDKYHGDEVQNGDETATRQRADGAQAETNKNNKELQNREEEETAPLLNTHDNMILVSLPELAHLKQVNKYPFDLNKDFTTLTTLANEFPTVGIIPLLKNWKLYIEDNPFKSKSSPRAQLRKQFEMAKKKGFYKKDNVQETRPGKKSGYDYSEYAHDQQAKDEGA